MKVNGITDVSKLLFINYKKKKKTYSLILHEFLFNEGI